ncbi:hypothetical protein AQPE_4884 [Aquipluma nitroreducens]|uniref:Uncharacterized protein n=1 Tax=Aquipluma nitroreducens TaxID=2010828 RepID=A0A5K7SGE9_9BACT|nr:hypothetical protein AQPE_4884 [Aquipluma nitroreducens]
MDYLNFSLVFCAIMILFEYGWVIIAFILMGLFRIFKSEKMTKIGMYLEKTLYCFFLISSTIFTVQVFREKNQSIVFLIFMILISLIYFVLFFADKRYNAEKLQQGNIYLHTPQYEKFTDILMAIEMIFILLFIPLVFFPNLIDNYLTSMVFHGLYYVTTIKILGIIIGVLGMFSLIKYIRFIVFRLFFIPIINKNNK